MGTGWSQGDDTQREITITEENSKPERGSEAKGEEGHHPHDLTESHSPPIPDQLFAGVFLNNRTMKHWVEKESKKKCFMLYARGLSIAWAENNTYWRWFAEKDAPSDEAPVELAELLNVCWLDANGRFDLSKLSPETTYEVVFLILVRSSGYGWEVPVNFRVKLPGGRKQEHKENLRGKPRENWIEIKAGEVSTSECKEGEMEVSMFEIEGRHWKSGLVLKGVLIRPKN
ncbi:uncharacterized protein PHLOEM PROTEIN 2-LIKE A4-like [Rhodamnia argentea]|uniref:Uncharacterized protein PHLOEM PROTEIN 2-LIKE A4 n=1 Tax=Rhodamnia argentea TaxID=178133 RepID=A0A8B8QNR7_9MYRT|nr:uncharacterized protein PHLOEM PROTEIN 2-LIKE A4 [Rhodamnia argentea]XP_048132024.1 uncharacterized protein PHLOEM PROTEIN 2-LIKE A4-like [Rhodamnia argentea]